MLVKFDLVKLREALKNFHVLTGVTISVFDAEHNQLIYYPDKMPRLCEMIKSCEQGNEACKLSDRRACKESGRLKKSITYQCHAGLVDTAAPIIYENTILGYMMFGQVMDTEHYHGGLAEVKRRCAPYKLNEKELEQAYGQLQVLPQEHIASAAQLLQMCACYLYISQTVKPEQDALASAIDDYISHNPQADLSLKELCGRFGISKNRLYALSERCFGCTPGEYVSTKRLERAKHLLTTTDMLVSETAAATGFSDYNYFIKCFRKKYGVTPLVYRKNFPHRVI